MERGKKPTGTFAAILITALISSLVSVIAFHFASQARADDRAVSTLRDELKDHEVRLRNVELALAVMPDIKNELQRIRVVVEERGVGYGNRK